MRNLCMLCVVSIFALTCASCTTTTVVSSTATQTGNAKVRGRIYKEDLSPAALAVVRFVPASQAPGLKKSSASAYTEVANAQGEYFFDSLPKGFYNVLGELDGELSFQDSIFVQQTAATVVPDDTLSAPGSIGGVVRLQPGDNPSTVAILVFGTNSFAGADAQGRFVLDYMAAGTYRVRIFSYLDAYNPIDTILTIIAGKDNILPDPIALPFIGIPQPGNVALSYDTLEQIATLAWDKAQASLVKGYNVYRRAVNPTSSFELRNSGIVLDTCFRDSSGYPDSAYEYQVTALDWLHDEGPRSAIQHATFVGPYHPRKVLTGLPAYVTGEFLFDTVRNESIYCTGSSAYPTGTSLVIIDSTGATALQIRASWVGASGFTDVAFGPNGTFVVLLNLANASGDSTRTVRMTRNGDILGEIQTSGAASAIATQGPSILQLSISDNLVHAFDTMGAPAASWSADSLGTTFAAMNGLCVDFRSGFVYVYGQTENPKAFTAAGVFVASINTVPFGPLGSPALWSSTNGRRPAIVALTATGGAAVIQQPVNQPIQVSMYDQNRLFAQRLRLPNVDARAVSTGAGSDIVVLVASGAGSTVTWYARK